MDCARSSRSKRRPAPDIPGSERVAAAAPGLQLIPGVAAASSSPRAVPIPRVVCPPPPAPAPVAAAQKKKRKKLQINPLCIPPSQYNANIFKMNQPFLKARDSPRSGDKFVSKMDDSVVEHAIMEAFFESSLTTDQLFKKDGEIYVKEMGNRPVHLSLLNGFAFITKPRERTIKKHKSRLETILRMEVDDDPASSDESSDESSDQSSEESSDKEHIPDNEDVLLCMGADSDEEEDSDVEEEEEQDDDSLSAHDEDEPNTPGSKKSDDSILLEHEGGRTDIAIKVFDPSLKKWITVSVVENKEVVTPQAMYQALCYACRRGLVNVDLGRKDPIYVMVWGGDVWKLGVIYISGVISVSGEQVISPDAKYHKKLTQARELVEKNFEGEFSMDGTYLTGSYYLSPETYFLPGQLPLSDHALIFYEFLMRIVIGEKVVKWSCSDVDEAIQVRRKIIKEVKEAHIQRANKRRRLV